MALGTLGTAADDGLSSLVWTRAPNANDVSLINAGIVNDANPTGAIPGGAFTFNGFLFVPNRGVLRLQPDDVVAFDDRGWPILVSADSIAEGSSWVSA